ncbi:uncharacterized protein LOC118456349 [Anopheles albimanus]|uniref:uncharacterized protein LOC118456349 n=1 Tax=Anopheles albimanus TaxID=7167 RepID=UPI00163EF7FD|nr:uncharacterized protein LOC118456349 [Anopheles albimanus]
MLLEDMSDISSRTAFASSAPRLVCTPTSAQNKQYSKEAQSIKSLIKSFTATGFDEKILDIYEFKEVKDEFDEQKQDTTRKLVSDVSTGEVVSSLTLTGSAAGSASGSTDNGLLFDDKRKKPLQR